MTVPRGSLPKLAACVRRFVTLLPKLESTCVNGPTPGTCVHAFIYDMKHKTTGKEAKGCVDYFEWGFDKAGLCVYGKCYWGNPGAVAATMPR